jgi:hypothetical protein
VKRTIAEYLLDPPPGSKAAEAKEFGIDLTLLIENLRLTPEQRVINLQGAMRGVHEFYLAGERMRKQQRDRTRTSSHITD